MVGILGARQVGKTTLARQLSARWQSPTVFFDLENPRDRSRLVEDPLLALESHEGLVVIDEVQNAPELFPILRVLVDRPESATKFLILGSASPDLLRQGSETLAGRIYYHEIGGFDLTEVGVDVLDRLWLRGGFPRSFLAQDDAASAEWRRGFIRTFLERDLPALGLQVPPDAMRRFWTMLAHFHGQVWNGAELARAFGVAETTARRYLDLLRSALVLDVLPPWFENLKKRQVKSPKVYLSDSGLLHSLLGLATEADLLGHPKVGASWEGFAIREVIEAFGARPEETYFWGTQRGAELDLLIVRGNRRWGFEFKRTSAPKLTPSMHIALEDLKLERLDVIYAGEHTFPLAERVRAVPLKDIGGALNPGHQQSGTRRNDG